MGQKLVCAPCSQPERMYPSFCSFSGGEVAKRISWALFLFYAIFLIYLIVFCSILFQLSCKPSLRGCSSALPHMTLYGTFNFSFTFLPRTSFEAGQHWNLVVLFCRVHKMEFPVAFLQDCARADKWLPFVCHAQVCQFPKEQVVHWTYCWRQCNHEINGVVFTPEAVAS